eukprot:s779_g21.t1
MYATFGRHCLEKKAAKGTVWLDPLPSAPALGKGGLRLPQACGPRPGKLMPPRRKRQKGLAFSKNGEAADLERDLPAGPSVPADGRLWIGYNADLQTLHREVEAGAEELGLSLEKYLDATSFWETPLRAGLLASKLPHAVEQLKAVQGKMPRATDQQLLCGGATSARYLRQLRRNVLQASRSKSKWKWLDTDKTAGEDMAPDVEVTRHLQGDGVNRQLFELIWRKDLLSQQSITLRIPDTIVFKYNFPSVWYFTSVDGTIKRKHKAKLDAEYILKEFLKRPLACGIVAYYVQTSLDVDDAQRGLVETGLAPTTIEYLNEEQLRELLFNRQMNRGDGLLQKFLEPPDARNNMIRAQWSPKVCLIERRINRLNLNDTHYDMYERAVTFEGPDFHSEVTPVRGATLANKVDQIADAIIQHVAGVTNDRVKITRLALNFKVDYRDRLHFLFASSVRLQGCSRPLEVNTRLQVPEYIHRAQSVSRTAPAVLLRSLVCPTCQEKVHPEMVFEVVYRVIIEFEEQRRNAERQAGSIQEQEEEEVPEAFLRLHPRLTVEEYVELRKELVFQQKFAGVCENCYLRFSTARLGAVQRLLAPELKGGDAAAEKQELGFLGTENAEAVQLVGTGLGCLGMSWDIEGHLRILHGHPRSMSAYRMPMFWHYEMPFWA